MGRPDEVAELKERLDRHDDRLAAVETHAAVYTTHREYMELRFDLVERGLERVARTIGRIGWFFGTIIGTALLGGFMTWAMTGGMTP